MKKQVSDIVITHETAQKLKAAGVKSISLFGYFKDASGKDHAFLQDEAQSGLPAYTSGELAELLPASLEVDKNAWRATVNSWVQIVIEIGDYSLAHLHTIKTGEVGYMAGYYYDGTMIAFSKNKEGSYNNLLLNGETEQEARANLLLELISEGKY